MHVKNILERKGVDKTMTWADIFGGICASVLEELRLSESGMAIAQCH